MSGYMTRQHDRDNAADSGFGIMEICLASSVLAIALMGVVGGLTSSLKLAINTKDSNLAHDSAMSVVEEFRKSYAIQLEHEVETKTGDLQRPGIAPALRERVCDGALHQDHM